MADENAEAKAAPEVSEPRGRGNQKPTLFIILAVINMLVVAGVGAMLFMSQKQKALEKGLDPLIKGEHEAQELEAAEDNFIGKIIPMETFLVNLAGSRGSVAAPGCNRGS